MLEEVNELAQDIDSEINPLHGVSVGVTGEGDNEAPLKESEEPTPADDGTVPASTDDSGT